LEVTNLLQVIHFSCNFILYFVLNVNFRRSMKDMLCACQKDNENILPLPNQDIPLRTTQSML
jgi:hypothetical protein